MKAKLSIQKIITWPGDISLRFLLWRDDLHWIWRLMLLMPAVAAHSLMRIADTIDDVFDHYKD